jgi:multidrug efflux pump subunit AcrA (membrane-fusion protein)
VEVSLIVSVIALVLSLLSVWYTRHAARAAKAQADAAKQQAAAAKAQLSLDQDRRNDELARRRKEEEEAARADLRVTTIWVRPHPPQIVLHNLGPHVASEISLSYLDADDASRRQTRHVGMNWRPRFDQNGQAAWMLTLA